MNNQLLTDLQILELLGERIRRKRINQNLSQLSLAQQSGISRRTVQAIEAGSSISLDKLIAILRTLDSLDSLDNFLPVVEISPLILAKMKGREKKRAYKKKKSVNTEGDDLW